MSKKRAFNPARFKKRKKYRGYDYRTHKPFTMRGAALVEFLEGMLLKHVKESIFDDVQAYIPVPQKDGRVLHEFVVEVYLA